MFAALLAFALEGFNLDRRDVAEILVQLAAFDLLAVDQQRVRLGQGLVIWIEITKEQQCIGRINALLAISKQTLILAFCLFLF